MEGRVDRSGAARTGTWRSVALGALGLLSGAGLFAAAPPVLGASAKEISWLVPEDPLFIKWASVVAPAFERLHPGVHVHIITSGSQNTGVKLLALVAAGKTPDVFSTFGSYGFYTLAHAGILADLTPYFQKYHISTNFIPLTYKHEFGWTNGHIFGVPLHSNPTFIAYNATLFEKYHVPLPPANWDDKAWNLQTLLADAKKLTRNINNPKKAVWGLVMNPGSLGDFSWLWNADPFNDKGGPWYSGIYYGRRAHGVYLTRPGMVEAMTWLADLITKWHVSPTPAQVTAMSTLGNPLFSGRVAMVEVLAGWLTRQAAVAKPRFSWGIAPMPYGPGGVDTAQREDGAWFLARTSAHPNTAFQFILFLTRGYGARELVQVAKDLPPRPRGDTTYFRLWAQQVTHTPGFILSEKQLYTMMTQGVKHSFPDPLNIIPDANQFNTPFTQIMQNVWIGKQSVQQALAQIQQKWEALLH